MATNQLAYKNLTIETIRSASCMLNESISLSTLPVDTLTVTVADEDGTLKPTFNAQEYGDIVRYYHDGEQIGKFYLENIEQVGPIDWKFNCISDMGLLVSSDHYGGLYSGQKASEVIADVIGGVIPYTLEDSLKEVEIYGWLKKASRRDNLRDVLFAIGGTIGRDTEGNCIIKPYVAEPEPYPVLSSSFYKTGGTLSNDTPASEIILTEHNFASRENDEQVTLFDGEVAGGLITTPKGSSVDGIIVIFDEPVHDLVASGTTILESGVNYAVLSTAAYGLLTGKAYTHTQRFLSREISTGGTPNIIQSSACTLVNIRNSVNVADRLEAFYGHIKRVKMDIVLSIQKPGDYISFIDPYGNDSTGYIESIEISFSKEMKASITVVCGFIPPVDIPMYFHSETFTEDTTWTVPEGVEEVRVVLIGGGPGGYSGYKGTNGKIGQQYTDSGTSGNQPYRVRGVSIGAAGEPGQGGPPASGAKVFSGNVPVTAGQQIQIHIGAGGTGVQGTSTSTPTAGNPGGATTFGTLSSDNGTSISGGYVEEISGQTYADEGQNSGQKGGKGYSGAYEPGNVYKVVPGEDVVYKGTTYVSGTPRKLEIYTQTGSSSIYTVTKGLGGGPAVGANGGSTSTNVGGKGATPTTPPAATVRGRGGDGGHGGGAGGGPCGKENYRESSSYPPYPSVSSSECGQGGNGGAGGTGGPGIAFIYYYSPEDPNAAA